MKRHRLRAFLFAVAGLILYMPGSAFCQEIEVLPKGQIIEKVLCKADPAQSYALFIPLDYTPDRKWPVLYCFDPVARGKVPVEQFRDAAEKYGYIVAGLNNSRNGPLEKSLAALDAVWNDTQTRFAIDHKRIYATGFSGGARVAATVGMLCKGCLAGVIGCGAGFSPGLGPKKDTPFVFFGTIGTEDFNFPELKQLEETLNKHGIANRIAEFEGGHNWASKEVCTRAIEWMELQAMKSGKRERVHALIDRLFNQKVEEAVAFEKSNKLYNAYVKYDALAADFSGLKDVSVYEKKVSDLKKTEQVKDYIKDERKQLQKQRMLEQETLRLTEMLNEPENRLIAQGQLRSRIADIRKDSEEADDSGNRRVARRALGHLFALFYEAGTIIHANNYELAAANLEVAAEIRPNNSFVPYRLACAYAQKGDKKKALAALREAVEKGFTNIAAIEGSEELAPIRDEDEYKKIIESIKAK